MTLIKRHKIRLNLKNIAYLTVLASCSLSVNTHQGEQLYQTYCATCHMDEGTGLASLYPPLAQSDYLVHNQQYLPCIIRHGIAETIVVNGITYDVPMEGVKDLSDTEIHNIIRYINSSWGNEIPLPEYKETEARLKSCNKEK